MGNSKGTDMQRIWMALGLALALSTGVTGCKDEDDGGQASNEEDTGGGATETNVQPAPCDDDSDCPEGIECVVADGAQNGFCNVNEMEVDAGSDAGTDASSGTSSAAPAPCEDETDCPEGIACIIPDGEDGPGFCDVEEMGISPSSAAPAPCMSSDECPEGIDCVFPNGSDGFGFCDVNEMIAP